MNKAPKILYLQAKNIKLEAEKILFVSDEKIWKKYRKFFAAEFYKILLLKNPKADDKNLAKIANELFDCDHILGFGSGTISDLCKYSAAKNSIPYSIIPSAASMNGYLSKNASITIKGYKSTLLATLPQNVFCDLDIISSAPTRLTKAGIGDSMCFYSCWFDWYLSHNLLGTNFDFRPFEILQEKMSFFLVNYSKFSAKNRDFVKLLLEILFLSGEGMVIANGSYPASQSEHMIAHTIEMKYPKIAEKFMHGEMIAITTFSVAELQKKILDLGSRVLIVNELEQNWQKKIDSFFAQKIANSCKKEYQEKLISMSCAKKITAKSLTKLQKIHLDKEILRQIFRHFKIKFTAKSIGLSRLEYQDCIRHAKFTRNRFTVLDLAS